MKDPLDILTGGTNPQCDAIDLTNHPTIQAAIEASYRQEEAAALAQFAVNVVSRALDLCGPFGIAAKHVLVGEPLPEGFNQPAAAAQPATGGTCPLQGMLQAQLPALVQNLLGKIKG